MKKTFIMALLCATASELKAQNTFPLPSGNVGIGTTTPYTTLHIVSGGNTPGQGAEFGIGANATSGPLFSIKSSLHIAGSQGDAGDVFFNVRADGNSPLNTAMTILQNGNIGIGVTSPTAKLTIGGGGNLNPNQGPETDYNGLNLTFKGENANGSFNLGSIKMVQGNGYYIDAADMVFSTSFANNNEKMRISREGNVSIGTTDSKGYKLAVNGNVIATSVTVKLYSAWPDYVFKPTYQLKPLSEVKTYIDLNHHLPDMPSEKEVADKGLDLGEMNKLLTKKVEELTLYLIEKDKEINRQQEINKKQEITNQSQDVKLQKLNELVQGLLTEANTKK